MNNFTKSFSFVLALLMSVSFLFAQNTGHTFANTVKRYPANSGFTKSSELNSANHGKDVSLTNVFTGTGNIEGHVYANGNSLYGAHVGIAGINEILTDTNGYYSFTGIPSGDYEMYAFKDGMNFDSVSITLADGQTLTRDFDLTPPVMIVSPLTFSKTLNPEEYVTDYQGIQNSGNGHLYWSASIQFSTTNAVNRGSIPATPHMTFTSPLSQEGMLLTNQGSPSGSRVDCPAGTVWGNPAVNYTNAYTSDDGLGYICYQSYSVENDFQNITFYFVALPAVADTVDFNIDFYQAGSTPGAGFASYSASIAGVNTGELLLGSYPIYSFTVELPDIITVLDGWISIHAAASGNIYYWVNTTTGSGSAMQNSSSISSPLSVCLGEPSTANWLSLETYDGFIPANGGSENIGVYFNAHGTTAGEVYTADIVYSADPNVSQTTVPATMIVAGDPLTPPYGLEADLANQVTGEVDLTWNYNPTMDPTFQYFLIRRDGTPVGNTTNSYYTDMLPAYGTYSYTVTAVYAEGETGHAGPAFVDWLIPALCYNPGSLYNEQWPGVQEQVTLTIENCGDGTLSFSFPGYTNGNKGFAPTSGFIANVQPALGQIVSGDSVQIVITYNSTGFTAGDYNEYLNIETNDPAHQVDSILNTMHVYIPATLYGTVTDCNTGLPVLGVDVTATGTTTFTASTDNNGYYEMNVDEDTYEVTFELLGYQSSTNTNVFAPAGVMTESGTVMCEMPYPVPLVQADVNQDDTECLITWSPPEGSYEIIYDDGTAEDYVSWTVPGNAIAVKFTPAGYPATVTGGRLYVGDGSFPANANFLGSRFAIGVMDDNGTNGLPGTLLDSIVVDVNNYYWVTFDSLNATITEGDFFLVMWQLAFPPNAAPVGVDNQNPTVYRSYVKVGNHNWTVSPYQDFMLRAVVNGINTGATMNAGAEDKMIYPPKIAGFKGYIATGPPKGIPGMEKSGIIRPVESQAGDRDMTDYTVALVDGFDPDAGQTPEDGTLTPLLNTGNTSYNDTGWGGLAEGWYAYAVAVNYESGDTSDWTYSNIVGHLKDVAVTMHFTLCDGETPDNIIVTLVGHSYPFNTYIDTTNENGYVGFDSVIKGFYDIFVAKVGYQNFQHLNRGIFADYSEDVILQKNAYPVRNLYVDPLTSVATWDEPLITQLPVEDFEDTLFPPVGWQTFSLGIGWIRSNTGSNNFPITPGDGYFAADNDDAPGSENDGSVDYLITPELDLRESDNFQLYFEHYYTGAFGEMATVEYSLDDGYTWELLQIMSPVTDWTPVIIDLGSLSGEDGVSSIRIAFHADDELQWASGWAVDNVSVHNGAAPAVSYVVYLDDNFMAELPATQHSYTFNNLQYGTTYTAAVEATYDSICNSSQRVYYTWTSTYLYPPRNLGDDYVYGTNEVPLKWNPPMTNATVYTAPAQSTVIFKGPQTSLSNTDRASSVTRIRFDNTNISRDTWDLQFEWPAFYNDGEAGVESDGAFIYTSQWNGNRFTKYTPDGTWVEDITIAGVSDIRDLAYDGTYFYGGAVSTTVFQMDFDNQVLVSTFDAPIAVRAIAYNDDDDAFYTNNWNTDIYEFDMAGNVLSTFSTAGLSGIYGMAYDNWSDGGPFLWVYDQGDNNLVQFQLPAGTPTGLTVDVQSITGTTGSAGGLFTQPEIISGTVTIGGNAQNDRIWGLELAPYNGGGGGNTGVVPFGLESFNVYREPDSIVNIPYNGEGVDDWIHYLDMNLSPGTYYYDVNAIYDLTSYGFPGQYGESALEGTDTVKMVWGMDIPFLEDWAQGTFEFNGWMTDSENWQINSQTGNDPPSAEFNWDPQLQNSYSSALTSSPINADHITEGTIWLDFDIKLNDRNSTGDEKLLVEVYDGQEWTQVAEANNANGSFDFEEGHNHIDITDIALAKVFQIRFNATGQNSFDIISWFVDNISVYRTCTAPYNLTGNAIFNNYYDDFGALVSWEIPGMPEPWAWIQWDDGTNATAIGLTDDGPFSVAARWDAGMLNDWEGQNFDGYYITKIRYFISDAGYNSINLKIWTGADATNLVWSEDVTASTVVGMWNEYTLGTPVQIDASLEYWVGYTIDGIGGMYPAGVDAGPAISGYGDMVTIDGVSWDPLSGFGLDYNWNIEFFAEDITANIPIPAPKIDNTVYTAQGATLVQGAANKHKNVAHAGNNRSLQYFNLYRKSEYETEYTLYDNIPFQNGVTSYDYYDRYPNVQMETGYYYKVTAVYTSDVDSCESEPAHALAIPEDDFVYVLISLGVDNPLAENLISLYPNPAKDKVTVTSSSAMSHIAVVNYLGQVVYNAGINDATTVTLNTALYEPGVYIVRIDTENGRVTKRLTITN